jgi:hypothetical protein
VQQGHPLDACIDFATTATNSEARRQRELRLGLRVVVPNVEAETDGAK